MEKEKKEEKEKMLKFDVKFGNVEILSRFDSSYFQNNSNQTF